MQKIDTNSCLLEKLFQDKLGTFEELNFKDDEDEHNIENWKFWHLTLNFFCQGFLKAPNLSTYSLLTINA
jgi:hypothetical protein